MNAPQMAPPKKSNTALIIVAIVVVVLISGSGLLCCFGGFAGMFAGFAGAEKAYYPECVNLEDSRACQSCCKSKGHTGYVAGEIMNEPGKACGCIGGEGVVEEKAEFDVVLTHVGKSKISVIKVVRSVTGKSLKDTKELVESAPATIKEDTTKADAEHIKSQLEAAGGRVKLK